MTAIGMHKCYSPSESVETNEKYNELAKAFIRALSTTTFDYQFEQGDIKIKIQVIDIDEKNAWIWLCRCNIITAIEDPPLMSCMIKTLPVLSAFSDKIVSIVIELCGVINTWCQNHYKLQADVVNTSLKSLIAFIPQCITEARKTASEKNISYKPDLTMINTIDIYTNTVSSDKIIQSVCEGHQQWGRILDEKPNILPFLPKGNDWVQETFDLVNAKTVEEMRTLCVKCIETILNYIVLRRVMFMQNEKLRSLLIYEKNIKVLEIAKMFKIDVTVARFD